MGWDFAGAVVLDFFFFFPVLGYGSCDPSSTPSLSSFSLSETTNSGGGLLEADLDAFAALRDARLDKLDSRSSVSKVFSAVLNWTDSSAKVGPQNRPWIS